MVYDLLCSALLATKFNIDRLAALDSKKPLFHPRTPLPSDYFSRLTLGERERSGGVE